MHSQRQAGIDDAGNAALLLGFVFLNYLCRLPALYRHFQDAPTDGVSFADLAGWSAVWSIFGVALVMYGLSGVVYFLAKRIGKKITGAEARRTMFWAANMCLPLIALAGMLNALDLSHWAAFIGLGTVVYFIWYWQAALNALGAKHV